MVTKSSKNEMLIFGLMLYYGKKTFDDWPSYLSDES